MYKGTKRIIKKSRKVVTGSKRESKKVTKGSKNLARMFGRRY